MTLKAYPIRFEIYDDGEENILAVVESLDVGAARVEIKTGVTIGLWRELHQAIEKAIDSMELK
jgi:hypothetical protein